MSLKKKLLLSTKYESISSRTQLLQKYFTENSASIPLYEVRKAQEHLAKLNKISQEKRDEIFPKKKFGFKSKQNMTSLDSAIESTTTKPVDNYVNKVDNVDNVECSRTIKDLVNEQNYIKKDTEINGQDVALINIKNSIVQIQGTPSVVYLRNIESSTILIGPITGAAFLNNISNSNIVIASHQLRIHETHDSNFYINVASRAIIENCKNVKFGPYSWTYPDLAKHVKTSAIQFENLNWKCIDDFNWLNQADSPNWAYLDEGKRVKWQTNENDDLQTI